VARNKWDFGYQSNERRDHHTVYIIHLEGINPKTGKREVKHYTGRTSIGIGNRFHLHMNDEGSKWVRYHHGKLRWTYVLCHVETFATAAEAAHREREIKNGHGVAKQGLCAFCDKNGPMLQLGVDLPAELAVV
jgi:predicted GIY-YIG superfamily endonuclease